jgi:hypothetical protein
MQQKTESAANKSNDHPIAALITPEWFYSESFCIFSGLNYSWDYLQKCEITKTIACDLDQVSDLGLTTGEQFEATFCSWYQSYHYNPREKWGIHIRRLGWMKIASHFCRICPNLNSNPVGASASALLYLITHSLFHYLTENTASLMELITNNPNLYKRYISSIYSAKFNTHNCLEESLANGYLFRQNVRIHIDKNILRKELEAQGAGYSDFVYYLDSNFYAGCRKLTSQILSGKSNPEPELPLEQMLCSKDYQDNESHLFLPVWLHNKPRPLHK